LIEFLAETGSTNADIAARLRGGEFVAEGHWLVADRQLAGRGRGGRSWFDGLGNYMGSTLVRPAHDDPPPATLALVAGLAVQQVVAGHLPDGRTAVLKWPNDVMVEAAKIAGILLERQDDAVIIGIGVNIAMAPEIEGRETIALAAFGHAPNRQEFANELERVFELELERWRSFGIGLIVDRWLHAGHPVGTPLEVGEPGDVTLRGTFGGLTADGALQLRLAGGTTRIINAGEVRFARP
jgi:BirA family biotin operon repressor/biotin-[acetyl-CoA-carboxylase] ligase